MQDPDPTTDAVVRDIVDAVGKVRRVLGVGLLERTYREALVIELTRRGRNIRSEVRVGIEYEGVPLTGGYVIDHVVDGVVVEAKACADLHPTAFAQTLTYIHALDAKVGLLVNFHAVPLRNGIHRLVRRTFPSAEPRP